MPFGKVKFVLKLNWKFGKNYIEESTEKTRTVSFNDGSLQVFNASIIQDSTVFFELLHPHDVDSGKIA